ncbi:(2Fe-2S)-binding protein [Brevibacillus nitrificans]|uniref:(2Fe-2S)-binding protein n=1 Tax=Brevibacillus nitrificans TaxID=651560 RepID=UPI0026269974|nr:(2Fe-2S)-binding protein [Brevibacillus nitrificans]MED1796941.1 (2Fe-2S)-binding protein [Brevibacillus nitrificans]
MNTREITVTVNGKQLTETVETRMLLADFIRDHLNLTGTHLGCEHGVCGACTVLVDGKAARSCLMLAVQADGCSIDTVESLVKEDGTLHPLQQAFSDNHALQCGFCTPGFMMTLVDFLNENPNPNEHEIREAISGNLCRCTGYANIVKAVEQASQALAKQGE